MRDHLISIYNAKGYEDLLDLFNLPLSLTAYQQFNELTAQIQVNRDNMNKDEWIPMRGSIRFTTKWAYDILVGEGNLPETMKWIWKSCCMPKLKFVCWLLFNDRLNTYDLLSRKNYELEHTECILCNEQNYEDRTHLFFNCPFSQGLWWRLNMEWNTDLNFHEMVIDAYRRYQSIIFMEIMIIGCWSIWIQRNNLIFEHKDTNINEVIRFFKEVFKDNMIRAKPGIKDILLTWINLL